MTCIDDPQDAVAAQMCKTKSCIFNQKAAKWIQKFAREIILDDKVQHLIEMGFEKQHCCDALLRSNGDQYVALNYLLQLNVDVD